jgi:hypothetical protein
MQTITTALTQNRGNMSATAEALGVTRQAIAYRVQESTDLQDLVASLNEARIDVAEGKLDEAVMDGEAWAVAMTLKTIGKRRGYVERTEASGPNGGAIVTESRIILGYDDGTDVTDE